MSRKVLVGVAVAVAVVIAAAASGVHLFPLLLVAVCPLSMVVMMAAMGGAMGSRAGDSAAAGSRDPTPAEELAQLHSELDRLRAERAAPGQADPNPERR